MRKTFILVALCCLILATAKFFGIIINTSPSMPPGIYVKKFTPVKRGDIVAACLDIRHTQLGLQHHYLKSGFACNGAEPVIKKIIAIPGDAVQLTDQYIQVNQKFYFYPTFYHDSRGTPLEIFPRGNYPAQNDYWLLGTNNPRSWDSRYWGPVPSEQIIENLYPLFTIHGLTTFSQKFSPGLSDDIPSHCSRHAAASYLVVETSA